MIHSAFHTSGFFQAPDFMTIRHASCIFSWRCQIRTAVHVALKFEKKVQFYEISAVYIKGLKSTEWPREGAACGGKNFFWKTSILAWLDLCLWLGTIIAQPLIHSAHIIYCIIFLLLALCGHLLRLHIFEILGSSVDKKLNMVNWRHLPGY